LTAAFVLVFSVLLADSDAALSFTKLFWKLGSYLPLPEGNNLVLFNKNSTSI